MATLEGRDRDAIAALVDRVFAAPDLPTFGRAVAEGLFELMPALSISYNEVNAAALRAFAVIVPEPEPSWWRYYQPRFEGHLHQHPVLAHRPPDGYERATTWDDVGDVRAFRATELFRQYYAPLGIESQLLLDLPTPDGVLVGVSVNRGPEGFDGRDRLLLDALRPHLVRAYRLVQLESHRTSADAVLADQGWVVVLADDDGVVTSTTFGAEEDPFLVPGDTLPEPLLGQYRAVVTAPSPPAAELLPREPVPMVWAAPDTQVAVSAAIRPNRVPPHVVHLRVGTRISLAGLQARGLTERQATVAAAMASGATNAAIAVHLGIAPATVKKHLEGIYRRLGVASRAAAVAAVSSSPPSGPRRGDEREGAPGGEPGARG